MKSKGFKTTHFQAIKIAKLLFFASFANSCRILTLSMSVAQQFVYG
jgi:hypothetical protein